MSKKDIIVRLMPVITFGIIFGFVEAIIVIYLRKIYYPSQTGLFPLRVVDINIYRLEVIRESATIIILSLISFISSRKLKEVPFLFLLLFGLWDIFYYMFLFILIRWPSSIAEYDVLFLIPLPWIAPVIAPVLVSSLFVVGSIIYLVKDVSFSLRQIQIFTAGITLIFVSFVLIAINILLKRGTEGFFRMTPFGFNYPLYSVGFLILIFSFLRVRFNKI